MRAVVFASVLLFAWPAAADDLARARALDQQGIKAYTEHRYNDAIRYFEESYRVGGPPFELWNIAKCRLELDQPDLAVETIERYLALSSLPADDRKEALQQLEQVKKRPSTLTVSSSPSGATVEIDAKGSGKTPLSVPVLPGAHVVTVTSRNHSLFTKPVEARYGRAIILDVPAEGGDALALVHDEDLYPVNVRGYVGVMFAQYGGVGSSAEPVGILTANYRLTKIGRASIAIGGLVHVTGDSWDDTVKTNTSTVPMCSGRLLTNYRSATALSVFLTGTATIPIAPKLDLGGVLGVGLAGYFAGDDMGGDLFFPTCQAAPGVRPAMTIGPSLDYALTRVIRLSVMPFTFHVQPAFAGTRDSPHDASAPWLRFTSAIGIGVDLR